MDWAARWAGLSGGRLGLGWAAFLGDSWVGVAGSGPLRTHATPPSPMPALPYLTPTTTHAAADLVIGYMGVPYQGTDMTSHMQVSGRGMGQGLRS